MFVQVGEVECIDDLFVLWCGQGVMGVLVVQCYVVVGQLCIKGLGLVEVGEGKGNKGQRQQMVVYGVYCMVLGVNSLIFVSGSWFGVVRCS